MMINGFPQEYTSVDDIPAEDEPVIVLTTPGSEVTVTTSSE